MSSRIGQIVVRYDRPAEYMLAGVPFLARVILTALNGAGAAAGVRPQVAVAGTYSPAYRSAVEKLVGQVEPGTSIDWCGDTAALPAVKSPGSILVITAAGLFTAELVEALRSKAGHGNALAAAGAVVGKGLWLLTPAGYDDFAGDMAVAATPVAATAENFCEVHDPLSLRQAEKWLFRRFGKSTDGFISRYLNRPVSTWVSRRLVRTPVTPNILTLLTASSAFLMFAVLQKGTAITMAVGCLLYHVTSIVDGFDGEVARAKFLSTRRGASFDTAVDMATNILFIIGLTIGLAKIYGAAYLMLGGLVAITALVGIALMTYVVWKGPKGGSFDVLQLTIRRRFTGWPVLLGLFEVANAIMKRDFFALTFGLLGIAGFAQVILWLLAAGMIAWVLVIIVAAPLVIGADPSEILPDHIGGVVATKNSQPTRPGE